MDRLRQLEERLLRFETAIAVVLVLMMLGLASYNVFYRNVLVPLQKHWAHSGPPITAKATEPEAKLAPTKVAPTKVDDAKKPSAEGFAGDFGDEPEPEPDDAKKPSGEGFAGDFGDEPEPEPDDAKKPSGEGFAGDFGDEPEPDAKPDAKKETPPEEDLSFDSEGEEKKDEFANLPMVDAAAEAQTESGGPRGGPPPEGSFAAWGIAFIDDIKLGWIDIFLRQLVIITSFLGAMLATQRRKHVNIDALSKLLSPNLRRWVSAVVNALAVFVCLVLASAGWDLVQIGLEFRKQLLPWAEEWIFQLMFPVGFGLLALHFGVRLLEAVTNTEPVVELVPVEAALPPDKVPTPKGDAKEDA